MWCGEKMFTTLSALQDNFLGFVGSWSTTDKSQPLAKMQLNKKTLIGFPGHKLH